MMDGADNKLKTSKEQVLSNRSKEDLPFDNTSNLLMEFKPENLVQGFIMSEVLGLPRARRRRGVTSWNSRF